MLAYACQLLQILLLFKNDVTFKSINLQTNKRYLQYCPLIVSLECTNKAKKPRFFKGLVTSQNIGYLFYFFQRMEGCREEKNFCEFEQRLVFKNIYTSFLIGENHLPDKRFFLPKPIVYILINIGLNKKGRLFFPWTKNSRQKTQFFFRYFFL